MFRFTLPLMIAALVACGDDDTDSSQLMCVKDPDLTIQGEAVPLEDFEFRNAFDPSDEAARDPDGSFSLPVMADAWGNRGTGAHGTLGVFPPGFTAPSHIHPNDYHGTVLRGIMTNPFGTDLEPLLDGKRSHGETRMGPGSYWYVPAGSQHTTTCVGPEVCWFYFHSEAKFDFDPIVNLPAGDLKDGVTLEDPHPDAVLLPREKLKFAGESGSFVQFASAFGDMTTAHGTYGLFNKGATSPVHIHDATYYGVVVSGTITNPFNLEQSSPELKTGGYWSVPADSVHVTACSDDTECLFYFHSRSGFNFEPVCE